MEWLNNELFHSPWFWGVFAIAALALYVGWLWPDYGDKQRKTTTCTSPNETKPCKCGGKKVKTFCFSTDGMEIKWLCENCDYGD